MRIEDELFVTRSLGDLKFESKGVLQKPELTWINLNEFENQLVGKFVENSQKG